MNLMKCELYFNKVFTKIERKLNPASGCEWIGADEGRTASSYRQTSSNWLLLKFSVSEGNAEKNMRTITKGRLKGCSNSMARGTRKAKINRLCSWVN